MHHELRIKSLLQVMRGNTATLEQIQAITGIEPLVVRSVLVNLQSEGVVYFTGKEYGLVEYAEEETKNVAWEYRDYENDRKFHLINISAKNTADIEELTKEPAKQYQVNASIKLALEGDVSNLEAAQIMWPKTAFIRLTMTEKAKTILVDAFSQLQPPLHPKGVEQL
jgi:hypothetical protein